MLNELIGKVKEDINNVEKNADTEPIIENFNRTINYLKNKSSSESSCFYGIKLD